MTNLPLILCVLCASVISSIVTHYRTPLIRGFKRLFKRKKKSTPTPAINNLVVDLNARVEKLETQVNKRQQNQRYAIRQEVKEYLKQLQK